ncbi:MAG: N5,N10-methylene tetrahydromethanopterin reductase [Actinomycetia bacterium]|jgi:alkanesulfonate monooxygenase SsuD/methylene tetrahydromethanopterin reductase-like flavin-dependent oxidoreductase (luciferase family)|nr:N5,N10-methylene tetrahydromethanopterin reductase [Actinomycetes bacterium]
MKVGVWMPNAMPFGLERSFFLDWVRLADQAGFDTLSTLDRPNYDMWDPLVSLAAAAAVTDRIRLATTTLPLPNRNEVLVAKQAAVIDRVSGGRLSLGVSLGSRPDDYQVFGATLEHRVTRFRRQLATIRQAWAEARQSNREHGVLGPPPVQDPGPPIWVGALTERARQRAVELADGFIFGGAARLSTIAPAIQNMRPQVAERGKPDFSFNAVAYIAIGGEREFAEAVAHHQRYYPVLPVPAEQAIHHGPIGKIKDVVAEYAACGLDLLVLLPEVRSLRQLELLSEHVLPEYRH